MNNFDIQQDWLFAGVIDGWDSWGRIFQSKEAFSPLIVEIFSRHGMLMGEITHLTPGTNAVFRVEDKVVKIFAPKESGIGSDDYTIELAALRHACSMGIATSGLVYSGEINDKYLFKYIVMDYIHGQEAEHKLPAISGEQKRQFAYKLKDITNRMNIAYTQNSVPLLTISGELKNSNGAVFPESLLDSVRSYTLGVRYPEAVFTHGDLTGENVILGDDGGIYIIDFADSHIAPNYYEWPPLVFSLLGCDPIMMDAYFGDYHNDTFYDTLTLAVCIHDFSGGIIKQICDNSGVRYDAVADVSALRKIIVNSVERGCMKIK